MMLAEIEMSWVRVRLFTLSRRSMSPSRRLLTRVVKVEASRVFAMLMGALSGRGTYCKPCETKACRLILGSRIGNWFNRDRGKLLRFQIGLREH